MRWKCFCVVLILIPFIFVSVQSYKLLCVAPMASHSHFQIASTVFTGLAQKGHEVTVISPFPGKVQMKNWKDISVAEVTKVSDEIRKHMFDMNNLDFISNFQIIYAMSNSITETLLKHENIQKLLRSDEKFDGVVLEYFLNEALMGLASHFKVPLILISPMPASTWTNHLVANPGSSAYIPNLLSPYRNEMTFGQRVVNTLYDVTEVIMKEFITIPEQDRQLKKYIPNAPPISEVRYNTSMFLINSHESINDAVPHVPNMIQIGGYHVSPTKQLSQDLRNFLDNSKDGVVLFSMGSNLKSAHLPIETRNGILRAFSKLKQKVLWKFEEDLPGLPANVKIHHWLPQQDILAHPNVVAFITHGGLLSTIEAVYFGVPIIGIPVFGDQMMNMAMAVNNGYAVQIPLNQLSEDTLSMALREILENPKYRNEVKKRSQIMHDREVKPLDSAVYWIEYAIRHNGAPHLRTAALKLTWYQKSLIDVYIFLGTLTAVIVFLISVLCKACCGCLGKSVNSDKKNR